jgi:hypothetical protein
MIDIKKLQEYVDENPQFRVGVEIFSNKGFRGKIETHEILSIEEITPSPFDDSDEEIICEIKTKLSTGEVLSGRIFVGRRAGLISKSDFLSWIRDKKIDEIHENMG